MRRRSSPGPVLTALAVLLASSSADLQAQHPLNDSRTTAIYIAVLQHLPPIAAGRDIVVDPRVTSSSLRSASAIDVWEHDLPYALPSAAVQRVHHAMPGITYCADTPGRTRCLDSAGHVHVMFGTPASVENAAASVEVTLASRTSDQGGSFDIQTWRYSFDLSPQGPVLRGREMLGRGHGRIRNN